MSKHTVFDNDSEEDDGFRINENYASRYDVWRTKEEYEKLKARAAIFGEEEEESSSEEEDGEDKDFGKPNNPEFDREFLLSLGTIYKHQKEDVDLEDVKFFDGDYRLEKEKVEKPMTLKDFERHVLTQRGGKFEEDEINTRDSGAIAYNAEKIKLADGLEDSDDEGDGLLTSGLFKLKEGSSKEKEEEANEEAPRNVAVEYVKGVNTSVPDSKHQEVLETVKGEWNSDKLTKKDKWLVDFFLNERYLGGDSDGEGYYSDAHLDEEEMSEDEAEEESNPLAAQYKFRHQEPGDIIKRHPRSVPDTLRQKDERRKERREAAKHRQVMKKEEKRKEIELLKAMKYKEIEEKIDRIREASGNDDIDLGDVNLEEDFDPAAHDAHMERLLGDNYFDDCNAEAEIPDFEYEDIGDETKKYDNWVEASTSNNGEAHGDEEAIGDDDKEEDYDGDFNMDADYDPENDQGVREKKVTRRKGRHQSKFTQALEKKKPLFDPKEKDFASYFDEYYKLDFEDVVGGIPCRFKYRKVECNDFGLTTGEILTAQNSDLNKWVGLRKLMQYDRNKELEDRERIMYTQRASYPHVKQKILASLYDNNPEDLAERDREKRRLRNLKRKENKRKNIEAEQGELENPAVSEDGKVLSNDKQQLVKDSKPVLSGEEHIAGEETLKQSVISEENGKSKKKKKHKRLKDVQCAAVSETSLEETTEGQMDTGDEVLKKKKKRKHRDRTEQEENAVVNESLLGENPEGQIDTDVVKKKKKRKHKDRTEGEESAVVSESLPEESTGQVDTDVVKKKKRKHRDQIEDEPIEDSEKTPSTERPREERENGEDNLNSQEIVDDVIVKKKKKDPILDSPDVETTVQSPTKKKKKHKEELAHTRVSASEEGVPPNDEVSGSQDEVNVSKKKKKKHRDQEIILETETGGKEKKHKKKKKGDALCTTSIAENPIKKRKSNKMSSKKIKKMKYLLKKEKGKPYFEGISDARLEAYGQNPKKLKNRVLYGNDL